MQELELKELYDSVYKKNREGMELAKRIEQLYYDKCKEYKNNLKLNFGVYFTPAEQLCYKARKIFDKKYGKKCIPNQTQHNDYFTNSMHVPVTTEIGPFDKIDIESELTGYSSAGCITYVEIDDQCTNNLTALEQIIDYAMEKGVPYFSVNLPNDYCIDCGTEILEGQEECPKCGSKNIQKIRRVTGYLTNMKNCNKGKVDEISKRYKHTKMMK